MLVRDQSIGLVQTFKRFDKSCCGFVEVDEFVQHILHLPGIAHFDSRFVLHRVGFWNSTSRQWIGQSLTLLCCQTADQNVATAISAMSMHRNHKHADLHRIDVPGTRAQVCRCDPLLSAGPQHSKLWPGRIIGDSETKTYARLIVIRFTTDWRAQWPGLRVRSQISNTRSQVLRLWDKYLKIVPH